MGFSFQLVLEFLLTNYPTRR